MITPKVSNNLSGQREVENLCQKLLRASREIVAKVVKGSNKGSSISEEKPPEENDMDEISEAFEFQKNSVHEITERFDREDFSENESENAEEDKSSSPGPLCVLPLHAMLSAKSQLRVFEEGREGERLVVVATNVAETSLTIPGIKYVVDTGKEKVKKSNSSNGMKHMIYNISKASASQRAGRAGRTGPGRCYRLYSSAAFGNSFPDFSQAEISKVSVDGVVLLMKSMNIGKVANFPFPTPPETNALIEVERCLKVLEALDDKGRLSPLGKAMARYPMTPRHSRMLLTVNQIMQKAKDCSRANQVLAYAVTAAAALSLSNPFQMRIEDGTREDSNEKVFDREEKSRKKNFSNPTSDALTIASALQCFEVSENPKFFCHDNSLHQKTM
ncbi:hypothetical protein ABFS83_07G003900 [Erythranthe nasuta]